MSVPKNISLTERSTGRIIYLTIQRELTPDHWYVGNSAPRLQLEENEDGKVLIFKETGMSYEPYTKTPTTDEGELIIVILPDDREVVYMVTWIDYPNFQESHYIVNMNPE